MGHTTTIALIGAIAALTAGVVSAIVALRKLKPESDQIIVSASRDVVVIQRAFIQELRDERDAMKAQMDERMDDLSTRLNSQLQVALDAQSVAEQALAACISERREVAALYDAERERNRRREQEMSDRIASLEDQVAKLQARAQSSQKADEERLP